MKYAKWILMLSVMFSSQVFAMDFCQRETHEQVSKHLGTTTKALVPSGDCKVLGNVGSIQQCADLAKSSQYTCFQVTTETKLPPFSKLGNYSNSCYGCN